MKSHASRRRGSWIVEKHGGGNISGALDSALCNTSFYPGVDDPADASLVTARSGTEVGGIDIRHRPGPRYSAYFKVEAPPPITQGTATKNAQTVRMSRNGLVVNVAVGISLANPGTFLDGGYATPPLPPGSYEFFYDNYLGTEIGHVAAAADGTFLLAFAPNTGSTERPGTVAEGRYLVSLNGLVEDQYLASAKFKGAEVVDTGVVIDGSDPGPLELTIQNGGSVEGTVRNAKDEPVADSRVVIVPAANRRTNLNLFKTAFTDQYGHFVIRGVAPLEYGVLAWEDIDNGAWENAEFIRNFESRAARVSVRKGSASNTSVRVITAP